MPLTKIKVVFSHLDLEKQKAKYAEVQFAGDMHKFNWDGEFEYAETDEEIFTTFLNFCPKMFIDAMQLLDDNEMNYEIMIYDYSRRSFYFCLNDSAAVFLKLNGFT